MGYKYGFVDNAQYSAADVNDVIKKLVAGGIEDPFTDGVAYNVTELNGIVQAISSEGVVPEGDTSCKCVINTEEENVIVSAGTAFFNNGSYITIDTEGATLKYEKDAVNYVYLVSSMLENRNYPVCSTSVIDGDVVLLAQISKTGVLTDKRRYVRGKLPGVQSNAGLPMRLDFDITVTLETNKEATFNLTADLGENNTYSIILNATEKVDEISFYDIRRNLSRSYGQEGISSDGYSNGDWFLVRNAKSGIHYKSSDKAHLSFEIAGNILNITGQFRTFHSGSEKGDKHPFCFSLILY